MKLKFSSHGFLGNTRRDIQISIPPYEADSDEYIRWIEFISSRSSTNTTLNYLNLEAELTIKGGQFPSKNKVRKYQLNAAERNKLRYLIKNIRIVNFVDDVGSSHVCDGGSFSIEIESPNVMLSFYGTNIFNGIRIEGLHELIEAVELIEQSKI